MKTNNTLITSAEDLDIVVPMHNLLEDKHNYSMTSGSLLNYCRDKIDNVDVNDSASDGCKIKIVGETPGRLPQARKPGDTDCQFNCQ